MEEATIATTTKKGWAVGPLSSSATSTVAPGPSKKKKLSLAEIMAEEEAEQTRREAENDAYQRAMEASMVDVDHDLEAAIALSLQEQESERSEVERALRQADAEQEAESYRLAMRLQAEEERLSIPTQRQPQGNVRIMTKQQLFLESKVHELETTGPGGVTLLGDREDYDEYEDDGGFRMNSARGSSDAWVRLDQSVIMGPNQELRTKHDIALNNQANAHRLGLNVDNGGISGVSNQAYNDFREKARRSNQKHQQRRRDTSKTVPTNRPSGVDNLNAPSPADALELPSVEEENDGANLDELKASPDPGESNDNDFAARSEESSSKRTPDVPAEPLERVIPSDQAESS